jgi:hypothetical protein
VSNQLLLAQSSQPDVMIHELTHWLQPDDMDNAEAEAEAFRVQLAFLAAMKQPKRLQARTRADMRAELKLVRAEDKARAMLTRNGTDGRVYGGDTGLVHIPDGKRAFVGALTASFLSKKIRHIAALWDKPSEGPLCPGCYMVALFDAAVHLANANGQPLRELGLTMSKAFADLAANPAAGVTEEITVILDPDDDA